MLRYVANKTKGGLYGNILMANNYNGDSSEDVEKRLKRVGFNYCVTFHK